MARPPIERAVSGLPRAALFKPAGIPARELERLRLTVDELEAIRLVDRGGLSHEQAAAAMGVSRQTVGRTLEHGRAIVAEALTEGKALFIEGGAYRVAPGRPCCRERAADPGQARRGSARDMTDTAPATRIAIPSDAPGGLTAPRSGHFGRCECFTIVDIVDGKVAQVEVLDNAPHVEGGCMAPVMTLARQRVDAIVVDGIGGRPLAGFNQAGIAVLQGTGVDAGGAVTAYLAGDLPVVGFEGACHH